jgi:hypothetical protein
MNIQTLVDDFAKRLAAMVETEVLERARTAMTSAFGEKGTGRTGAAPLKALPGLVKKSRRKAPLQLCPVPGCKNPAAPVFGMVCAKHKDVAKYKIRKYREARKAKKAKLKAA